MDPWGSLFLVREETNLLFSFLTRKILPHGSTPMDHVPRLKKMTLNKIQKMGVGALTRLQPLDLPSPTAASSTFPFEADLFGAMRTILSCFTLGG